MEDQDQPTSPREAAKAIDEAVSEMMSINAEMISKMRQAAREMQGIQLMHLEQANRAYDIAQLIAVGAKLTSDLVGDLLTTEFDIADRVAEEYEAQTRGDIDDDDEEAEEPDED